MGYISPYHLERDSHRFIGAHGQLTQIRYCHMQTCVYTLLMIRAVDWFSGRGFSRLPMVFLAIAWTGIVPEDLLRLTIIA